MNYFTHFMLWLMIDIATNPFITIAKIFCITLALMVITDFITGRN